MLRLTKQKSTLQITMIKEQVRYIQECPSNRTMHDAFDASLDEGQNTAKALSKREAEAQAKRTCTVYKNVWFGLKQNSFRLGSRCFYAGRLLVKSSVNS